MSDRSAFSFSIDAQFAGNRADAVVSALLPDCSRSAAAALIRKGEIRVSGPASDPASGPSLNHIKKPAYRLRIGDIISGRIPRVESMAFAPEAIDIEILFEDSDIVVINKDAGMVVHPAPGNYSGTLANAILYHCPGIETGAGEEIRPGIVHRLDKDTSGVMVVAKNSRSHNALSEQFKLRTIRKKYLAVVYGVMKQEKGTILNPIGRHPVHRKKMCVFSRKGRNAETRWYIKKTFYGAALLELDIRTGRTHQIRVHCASSGHPVVGDTLYCGRNPEHGLPKETAAVLKTAKRQMLHAETLSLNHPATGEHLIFEAPLPQDMVALIASLESLGLS